MLERISGGKPVGDLRGFRPEIEGLRAIAALLVAAYHIWLGRVSGGVDAFFVVSGFLITGSLFRDVERDGALAVFPFWARLIRRLLPSALLVLLCVLLASLAFLPDVRWEPTAQEILASTLYVENWQLALNAVDYLARENALSPVQHFWALSMQAQFYGLWMLLAAGLALAAPRIGKRPRDLIVPAVGLVFCASLAYSVAVTATDQPWAYFDTLARIWEFALGALVALFLPRLAVSPRVALLLGWFGLAAIVTCGLLFQASTVFPGFAAFWPTMAAAAIIIAGSGGGRFGVHHLLGSKRLVALGARSYGLYLWHWPLLVFFRLLRGGEPGLVEGVLLIVLAVILADLTYRFVEGGIRRNGWFTPIKTFVTAGAAAGLMVTVSGFWLHHVSSQTFEKEWDSRFYPGAMAMVSKGRLAGPSIGLPVEPSPLAARKDLPRSYRDRCHGRFRDEVPPACIYRAGGDGSATGLIALVGGSHSIVYLPAIEWLSKQYHWDILILTRAACRFTADSVSDTCATWNDGVRRALRELHPDLVVTTANVGPEASVPEGYLAEWKALAAEGIRVLALRDNPWFPFDVAECVDLKGPDSPDCAVERDKVLAPGTPEEWLAAKPEKVHFLDLSEYLCDAESCPPVIGNVLAYRDSDHLTATFARTLGPIMEPVLAGLLGDGRKGASQGSLAVR